MPDDPQSPATTDRTLKDRLADFLGIKRADELVPSDAISHLRVKEFENASVRDVMTSRVDIAALDVSTSLQDVLALFSRDAHSRMPVYNETLDEPLGFVHIKDVVAELVQTGWTTETLASRPLDRLKRTIMFIPESMKLPDLLLQMQASRTHIALVVDEFGGTAGLVCLEDVVEVIVGDIEDEHDEEPPLIVRRGRNIWDVDGLAELEDVERETGLRLDLAEFAEDVETLGGLVAALAGRVPAAGDSVPHPAGPIFEVISADPRRATRVRVRAAAKSPPGVLADGRARAIDRGVE
jgi:CBS domain containing-hemolysin-like protein